MATGPIDSLVVCAGFDDFLAITLPRNKRHFCRTLVVTSCSDGETQRLAYQNDCPVFATDAFYANGADFNKGLAIEKALDVLGREGWLCLWDADIVMPDSIKHDYCPSCLYTPLRRNLKDPSLYCDTLDWQSVVDIGPAEGEYPGYFHLFHGPTAGPKPWYTTDWRHAGGCDSDFQKRFPPRSLRRPPFEVLHLGPTVDHLTADNDVRIGENRCGRITPRIDTGAPPPGAEGHRRAVQSIVRYRGGQSTQPPVSERLGSEIPRRMSFFWTGPMSWLRNMTLRTFVRHNPGWEVRLYFSEAPPALKTWKSDMDDDHEYTGLDYQAKVPQAVIRYPAVLPWPMSAAQACDWFQWRLLATDGGWFSDMDIIWIRPMDAVIKEAKTADAVFCLESGMMAIGLVGAKPGCKLFNDLAMSQEVEKRACDYQYYGTDWVYRFAGIRPPLDPKTCPGEQALRRLRQHYSNTGPGFNQVIADLPSQTVYPLGWRQIDQLWKADRPVDPRAIGLHWFGGHRLSRYWSQMLTEENLPHYGNTVVNYLRRATE